MWLSDTQLPEQPYRPYCYIHCQYSTISCKFGRSSRSGIHLPQGLASSHQQPSPSEEDHLERRRSTMGTAAGTVARQIVNRAVASAAAASSSSRPVASLAASPFRIAAVAAAAAENQQPYPPRSKVTSAPPPGPNSSLLEPTWRESSSCVPRAEGDHGPPPPIADTPLQPPFLRLDGCSSPGAWASVRNAGPDRPLSAPNPALTRVPPSHSFISTHIPGDDHTARLPKCSGALHIAPTTFISPLCHSFRHAPLVPSLYPNSTSIRILVLPPCNRTTKPKCC